MISSILFFNCRGYKSESPSVHPNMNMDQQKRFEAQEKNTFFADGRSMRQPLEGTIARGHLKNNDALYEGRDKDGNFVNRMPVEVTHSLLKRGMERYNIYCSPCHGIGGYGDGVIIANNYGYVPPPSYHEERIRNMPDGELYSAIANGVRTMPSYAIQIQTTDRWAIVAYIKALQRSQYVSQDELDRFKIDSSILNKLSLEK